VRLSFCRGEGIVWEKIISTSFDKAATMESGHLVFGLSGPCAGQTRVPLSACVGLMRRQTPAPPSSWVLAKGLMMLEQPKRPVSASH